MLVLVAWLMDPCPIEDESSVEQISPEKPMCDCSTVLTEWRLCILGPAWSFGTNLAGFAYALPYASNGMPYIELVVFLGDLIVTETLSSPPLPCVMDAEGGSGMACFSLKGLLAYSYASQSS